MSRISDRMRRELERLALLREDEIDTVDLPEETNWSGAQRSRFSRANLTTRDYDVRAIANWFIRAINLSGRTVTNLSLNKLVYFAVERFLVERNILLTRAKIEAWNHGPVFREIYHALNQNGDKPITSLIERFSVDQRKMMIAEPVFEPEDMAFLKTLAATYGRLSGAQLRALSHRMNEPWDLVWNGQGNINPGMEISLDTIIKTAPKRRNFNGQ